MKKAWLITTIAVMMCSILLIVAVIDRLELRGLFQAVNEQIEVDSSGEISDHHLDRVLEMSVEGRRSAIKAGHQNFLNLPVSNEYVHSHILPEIVEKRKQYFPEFPERGATREESNAIFTKWLEEEPDQLAAYMKFLADQYAYYEGVLTSARQPPNP